MKALFKVLIAAALTTAATGCENFLDINDNPNNALTVTPDALLANALVTTAANYTGGVANGNNYNTYASFAAGYWGKSGTVSGFSPERTYTYNNTYNQSLFNSTYDNIADYDLIQRDGATTYPNHAAIARIMKVYNYLLLVDQFGDIPYTQALKGLGNTAPKYDSAESIYKDLVEQLKGAVADINNVPAGALVVGNEDVVFNGGATGMARWKAFANSLRLRILLRQSSTNDATRNTYVSTELRLLQTQAATATGGGFIDRDVVVQPSYTANTNQQNPFYDRYGFAPGATRAQSEYSYIVPTNYIIRQYETNSDPRIAQLYRRGQRNNGPTDPDHATAAYVGTDLGEGTPPQFSAGDCGCQTVGSRFLQGGTFLRAATAPTVLMLLSEHLFNKAEVEARGLFGAVADAKQDFNDGIKASFVTTYREAATVPATVASATSSNAAGIAQYNDYVNATANQTNGLVNYDAPTTRTPEGEGANAGTAPLTTPRAVTAQEKILYQKYLAENTIAAVEALDDIRRTGLPRIKLSLQRGGNPLPKRLFYPQSEVSTNQANIPSGVTQFTKIFWQMD
ncbi:SusD/RagB family nutrient-binding outer membrane lipoprotein [Hymenobacter wooponensis]|uniref:SusD/RagB family nutrient-binding outer membrane lipoprotein n=1 Tax=Hymenobacter wooponensis TaxID=1525360 RepID=A0A4Z0MHX1_9BACT|nr:SusD/RagB family nutrient-binding outer membrane lipoprotein [Hymenobacter wooponensis]TGD78937.1 SusD/RagB family nutrient-binding outer membrane lipoprotein [Hymenobacter wooponensis]